MNTSTSQDRFRAAARAQLCSWQVDALACWAGLELRLDYDTTAPLPWAVWGADPTTGLADELGWDIIGAGETPGAAIDEARRQLAAWAAA